MGKYEHMYDWSKDITRISNWCSIIWDRHKEVVKYIRNAFAFEIYYKITSSFLLRAVAKFCDSTFNWGEHLHVKSYDEYLPPNELYKYLTPKMWIHFQDNYRLFVPARKYYNSKEIPPLSIIVLTHAPGYRKSHQNIKNDQVHAIKPVFWVCKRICLLQPAQLQRLIRILIFFLKQAEILHSITRYNKRIAIMVLIRLRGCQANLRFCCSYAIKSVFLATWPYRATGANNHL